MPTEKQLDQNGRWLCPRGHDKSVVGVENRRCTKCRNEDRAAYKRRKRLERGVYYGSPLEINNLKAFRERLGLSKTEFAELCGVGRSTISHIERGRRAGHTTYHKILATITPILRRMNGRAQERVSSIDKGNDYC